ncbi:pyridoxamine 5'-phosphate oxidase family protein [Chloroflexota bacterium]
MKKDYSKAAPNDLQRRPQFTRDDDWIRSLLRRGEIARLAHLSGDQPFISPTNYWFDEENHQLVFHSSLVGRRRANLEQNPRVCVEVSEVGRVLPSNSAAECSQQFRSVMVFGKVVFLENKEEKLRGLYGILKRYFPELRPGKETKPISDKELNGTNVYVVQIESWSGKENWKEQSEQVDDWPQLLE